MDEKLNLLGKQQQGIITIPEWFMLYMIKARVREPAPGPEEKSEWIVLLEGDSLTMPFTSLSLDILRQFSQFLM